MKWNICLFLRGKLGYTPQSRKSLLQKTDVTFGNLQQKRMGLPEVGIAADIHMSSLDT